MTADEVLAAMDLPPGARVDRRVPKTLLVEHGAPTAADKRAINDGIGELHWVAALKPDTIAVPAYRDATREYLEIAVLRLNLRTDTKVQRLVELVHRAVPYPLVLLLEGSATAMSLAHKRWAQNEGGKTVLDGQPVSATLGVPQDAPYAAEFLRVLALGQQPRTDLRVLYQGWLDTVLALLAARRTGQFVLATSADRAGARRDALNAIGGLEAEAAKLRAAAAKERQVAKQVELNLALRRIEAELAQARAAL
jgi:hypothetical protein